MYILPFIQRSALSVVLLTVSDGALADLWALPLQLVLFFPTLATFSPHHADAEGKTVVGQLTELRAMPNKTSSAVFTAKSFKLWFSYMQGAEPSHLTLLCHCHMALALNAERQSSCQCWGETG